MDMTGTGMQNPIFNLVNNFSQGNNNNSNVLAQSNQINSNSVNQNMMMNMNILSDNNNFINNNMQNMANSQKINQMNNSMMNQMNNPMMNQMNNPMMNQMNNPVMNPMNNQMNNPMMNPMMNNMNTMSMAQISQQIQNQYYNQLSNNAGNQNSSSNLDLQLQTPNDNITVVFRTSNNINDYPLKIQCRKDEKISALIERYRTKAMDHDNGKKFIFNAQQLKENLTVAEAGLSEGSNIFVVSTTGIKGG